MSPDHWNSASMLPPVGCPLLLNLGSDYGYDLAHAERVDYLTDRGGEMTYRLSTGELITGRFLWTYP